MKKLNMLFMTLSGEFFSSIVLIAIISYSLIAVEGLIGEYRYITHSEYILSSNSLTGSDYFMSDAYSLDIADDFKDKTQRQKEDISRLEGVKGIADTSKIPVEFRSSIVNLNFYNEYMMESFQNILTEGKWFEHSEESEVCVEAILSGAIFNDISVGSEIDLLIPNTDTIIPVKAVGKIDYPWYAPDYNTISEDISADKFLVQANVVIIEDNKYNRELLPDGCTPKSLGLSYFVLYKDSCTPQQKQAVRDHMSRIGTYKTYDEIFDNTHKKVQKEMIDKLVTPCFLLVISTILLISIAVMTTHKKLRDHAIYYLCGCSRKKSFLYLTVGISVPVLIAVVLNTIYEVIQIKNLMSGSAAYAGSIVDQYNILIGIIYCVVTIAVAMVLPFIIFSSNSPVDIYRRNHND